jgi:uncharacterized membrane protein
MEPNRAPRSLIGESLSFAFDAVFANIGAWLVACLTIFGFAMIGWAVMALFSFGVGGVDYSTSSYSLIYNGVNVWHSSLSWETPFSIIASILTGMFAMFYYASMMLGLTHMMLQFYNTGAIRFRPFFRFDSILVLLAAVVMILPLIVGGLILFIIPGFIVMMRSFFISYFIVDKNLGPVEAIKASWAMTKDRSSTILALLLMSAVMNCVPIVGWLMSGLMIVYVYKTLIKAALPL